MQRDLEQDLEVWRAGKSKLEDKCRTLEARNSKQKVSNPVPVQRPVTGTAIILTSLCLCHSDFPLSVSF